MVDCVRLACYIQIQYYSHSNHTECIQSNTYTTPEPADPLTAINITITSLSRVTLFDITLTTAVTVSSSIREYIIESSPMVTSEERENIDW